MFESVDIIVVQSALGIGTPEFQAQLRASLSYGAVIELSTIRSMINASGPAEDSDRAYSACVTASQACVRTYLKSGYAPVAILGILRPESVTEYRTAFARQNIMSLGVYAHDDAFVRWFTENTRREKFAGLRSSSDILARRKHKRRWNYATIKFARAVNKQTYDTRDQMDAYVDASGMEAREIATSMLRAVRRYAATEKGDS